MVSTAARASTENSHRPSTRSDQVKKMCPVPALTPTHAALMAASHACATRKTAGRMQRALNAQNSIFSSEWHSPATSQLHQKQCCRRKHDRYSHCLCRISTNEAHLPSPAAADATTAAASGAPPPVAGPAEDAKSRKPPTCKQPTYYNSLPE